MIGATSLCHVVTCGPGAGVQAHSASGNVKRAAFLIRRRVGEPTPDFKTDRSSLSSRRSVSLHFHSVGDREGAAKIKGLALLLRFFRVSVSIPQPISTQEVACRNSPSSGSPLR